MDTDYLTLPQSATLAALNEAVGALSMTSNMLSRKASQEFSVALVTDVSLVFTVVFIS